MLRLSEFELDEKTGVRVPPGSGAGAGSSFSYSDGVEEELRLLSALNATEDISDNTASLLAFVNDWQTYYHLAPGRSNAIRALGLPRDISILELGAGCGALARHLGENHRRVHSVEGSARRAAICRARCKDLAAVTVFQADFSDVAFDAEYDVVVLNGVLEYAPSFFRGSEGDPVASLIQLAKSALTPGGLLLIAIENKLGLKYWCGAQEDHTATQYEGLHGYPSTAKVQTFSRQEIAGLLSAAGFPAVSFFYCFPDYKFASTILSATLPPRAYLHNWLDFPAECPGLAREYTIHEGLTGKSVYEAGLLGEFANSFLVGAGLDGAGARFERVFRPDWIAKRLSVRGRGKALHRLTTLHAGDEGELVVTKEAVSYPDALDLPEPVIVPWTPGELVLLEMCRAVLGSNRDDAVHALLAEYHQALLTRFSLPEPDSEGYALLQGRCIDFLLRNLIRGPEGLVAIDLEWEAPEPVAIDFMLFRSLWNDVIAPNHAWISRDVADFDSFIVRAIRRFYPNYGFARHALNKGREQGFLADVGRTPTAPKGLGDTAWWMAGRALVRPIAKLIRDKAGFSR